MRGSVPAQGPEEGRGAPPGEEQQLCQGECPGQGRRSGHTLPGEVGRMLPAPGTARCPGRVGIVSGSCSHRPRLRLCPIWHRDESRRAGRISLARSTACPSHPVYSFFPSLLILLSVPSRPTHHTKLHLQTTFPKASSFLRSHLAGHPEHCLAVYQPGISWDGTGISRDGIGISRDGISRPSPPSSAPGWGAVPQVAPAMPALLPLLEASQADSPQLGRAAEEPSSPICAPKPSESSAGGTGPM